MSKKSSKPPPSRTLVLSCSISHISNGLFKKKWKSKLMKVYDDGLLEICDAEEPNDAETRMNLKIIYRCLLLGSNIQLFHIKNLPQSTNVSLIMGYPKDYLKKKMKYKWILFKLENDYNKFKEIMKQLTTSIRRPKMKRQNSSQRSLASVKLNQSFDTNTQQGFESTTIDPSSNDMTEFIL